jgi:hypothetical protein
MPGAFELDADIDNASHEAQIQLAWEDALHWAKLGDYELLIARLRGDLPIAAEVRAFFVDLLAGKVRRPRGKPVKRPDWAFAIDENDRIVTIDKRHARLLAIRRWVRANKTMYGKDVLDAAAKHFNVRRETIEHAVRRSSKALKPRSM